MRGEAGTQENIDNAVAVLLAFWGWKLDAQYSPSGTGARLVDVPAVFEDEYGIYCEHVDWNSSVAISQLVNKRVPVIIRSGVNGNLYSGHTWIVDGYYEHIELINYYYQGFDTSNPSTPLYKTVQQQHTEEYFLMNWGYGGYGDTGTYFVDSSEWVLNGDIYSGNKKMVYNFHL